MDVRDYSWTTGDDENLVHVERIGFGGNGEVHKVRTMNVCSTDGL